MSGRGTTRRGYRRAGLAVLAAVWVIGLGQASAAAPHRARWQQQPPAPIERRPPAQEGLPATAPTAGYGSMRAPGGNGERRSPVRGEHLADWMSQHSNLTPEQQQQALQREPGFTNLPQQTQERYLNRLAQLNAMNPLQRQRRLANIEAMERLNPQQREQVRGALGQLGSLPPDQRAVVAHTFNALRVLPPEQRMPALESGRFGPPLNDAQRSVMSNLLRVEPILPPAPRALRNGQGQPQQPMPSMQGAPPMR